MNKAREPIATWYDANCRWRMEFEPVPVVAFTDKTVTILKTWRGEVQEDRLAIVSEYHHFYPTFEEAKIAVIEGCKRKIEHAEEELLKWKSSLSKAEALEVGK